MIHLVNTVLPQRYLKVIEIVDGKEDIFSGERVKVSEKVQNHCDPVGFEMVVVQKYGRQG